MKSTPLPACRRTSVVIILLLFFTILLEAQIKIKERVDINPLPKTFQSQSTQVNTDRYIHIEYSASTEVPIRLGIYPGIGCPGEETWVGGYHSVTLSYKYTGAMTCGFQVRADALQDVPFHLVVRADASEGTRTLLDITGIIPYYVCVGGGFTCDNFNIYNVYANLDYSFFDSVVCSGQTSTLSLKPRYEWCSSGVFDPAADTVTLTVIRGEELGGIQNVYYEHYGEKSISFPLTYIEYPTYVWFHANDPLPPGVIVDTAKIQIRAGTLIDTMSLVVRACSRGTSFNLFAAKPKIYVQKQDTLFVQPAMDNSSTIVWDKTADPVTFTITSGSEYGWFALNGEQQGGTSITLQGTQLDQLSFLACESLPEGVSEGQVTVQAESKGIVKTVSIIVLPAPTLKLTLSVDPTSISYGDCTYVSAQTVNVTTEMPEAPESDVTYTFALTGGNQYARFWKDDYEGGISSNVQVTSEDSGAHVSLKQGIRHVQLKNPALSLKKTQNTIEHVTGGNRSARRLLYQKKAQVQLKKPALSEGQTQNKIASIAGTRTTNEFADDGEPDVLAGVSQDGGYADAYPEATDQEPLNPEGEIVQLTVSASDAAIQPASAEFRVMPSAIRVTVSPSTIKQGEQAAITVQKKNESGAYEDLPADAVVGFYLTKGYWAGVLSSPNGSQTGSYIEGRFQSATFTANVDNVLPNDNPVRITVYTDYGSGLGKLTVTKEEECVQVQHASVSVGDTISLSFVYKPSGDPVPADKSLDVMISGEEGLLLVNGSTGTSFSGAAQPIKYIAPTSISGDSLVVSIAASMSSSGGGPASSIHQKDSVETPSGMNNTISPSILKLLKTTSCESGSVTVKQECAEPINECSNEQLQPQQFSSENIRVYSQGEIFQGKDQSGYPFSAIVDGCSYDPTGHGIKERAGVTIIMPKIPLNPASGNPYFVPCQSNSFSISVCLDPLTKRWVPHISDFELPIFMSFCQNNKYRSFYGDGTDQGLLSSQIPNEDIYDQILDDLDFWIKGSYSSINKIFSKTPDYVFPVGILEHENWHMYLNSQALKYNFNKAFIDIVQINNVTLQNYHCPSEAIQALKISTSSILTNYWNETRKNHSAAYTVGGDEDKNADIWARITYERIKKRIEDWGKSKGW